MKQLLWVLSLLAFVIACDKSTPQEAVGPTEEPKVATAEAKKPIEVEKTAAQPAAKPEIAKKGPARTFGAAITVNDGMSLTAVADKLDDLKGKPIRVDGQVGRMCVHKGDWLSWKEGDHQIVVQFKDNAFTVPADIRGHKIQAQGYVLDKALPKACDNPEHQGKALPGGLQPPAGKQVFFVATGLKVLEEG